MKLNKDVIIILLNYNGTKDTIECVESIKKNEKNPEMSYEIIVVDNNSTDNSVDLLKKNDEYILIEADRNNGFSSGNNIGIKYAKENYNFKYILLLNNDTIIENNSIYKLYKTANGRDGIFSGRLYNYYNHELLDSCGGDFSWKKIKANYNYTYEYNNELHANSVIGACMLISYNVIEKVGLLSEDFFMYYEDVDYCIRTKEQNYNIIINPDSIIYHKGGASTDGASPFAIEWNTRNRIVIFKKYKYKIKFINRIYFTILFALTRSIYLIKYVITGKYKYAKALCKGITMGIKWR